MKYLEKIDQPLLSEFRLARLKVAAGMEVRYSAGEVLPISIPPRGNRLIDRLADVSSGKSVESLRDA